MQRLVHGIQKFQRGSFIRDQKLFETLADGQNPLALLITCSDSRIDPNRLTQTKPGELFIQRTAGNIVPPYGSVFSGEAATIEYAVSALKLRDIIICGHSNCGAMAGLLDPASVEKMPAVRAYLEYAKLTRRIVEDELPAPDRSEKATHADHRRKCPCADGEPENSSLRSGSPQPGRSHTARMGLSV